MNTYRASTFGSKAFSFVKRSFDILGSLALIVLLFPLCLVVAVIAAADTKGTPIFVQTRMGRNNVPFRMLKFRTMSVDAPSDVATCKLDDPQRYISKVGGLIRRLSIDELPQLFNILKGDMSLVGPRPERPFFVEKFREEIPRYMIKHQVRPGLTGWAQVNGYRGDTSIKKRIEHDLYYIENWTLGFDFKIIFLTFFKGFINKNAY